MEAALLHLEEVIGQRALTGVLQPDALFEAAVDLFDGEPLAQLDRSQGALARRSA